MTAPVPTYENLLEKVSFLEQNEVSLNNQIAHLKEQLEWFRQAVFGKKSERHVPNNPQQLLFFPELEPVPEKKSGSVSSYERRKPHVGNKMAIPDDLPVEREVIDLSEEEKVSKVTGEVLVKIGEEITRKLAYRPGSFFVKEIVRIKYGTPSKEGGVQIPPLPPSLLERCYADESLLASIMTWKYVDHMPLYRQEEVLAREGVIIPRQLMSKWVLRAAEALTPLHQEMEKRILASQLAFIDETPLKMQGKDKLVKAYMWILCGGEKAPYRTYHFYNNRNHQNARDLLKDYKGILHSDKYGAYVELAKNQQIIWCPCMAHVRRQFYEAQSGDGPFRALMLRLIRYLFMLERVAWNRSPEERLRIRQEKEVPILERILKEAERKLALGKLLPQSNLRKALGYLIGLTPYLKNYTKHPEARLDNNKAERAVRPLALGRKNWLFVGSEDGGDATAVIYSLVQTAKDHGLNPREYLEDVMRRLQDHPASQISDLLPDRWVKSSQA